MGKNTKNSSKWGGMPKKRESEDRGGHEKGKNGKLLKWRKFLCKKPIHKTNINKVKILQILKNIQH